MGVIAQSWCSLMLKRPTFQSADGVFNSSRRLQLLQILGSLRLGHG
jgi:hypothetical protein